MSVAVYSLAFLQSSDESKAEALHGLIHSIAVQLNDRPDIPRDPALRKFYIFALALRGLDYSIDAAKAELETVWGNVHEPVPFDEVIKVIEEAYGPDNPDYRTLE